MAKKEPGSHEAEHASAFDLIPAEFAAANKKRIENLINAQTELLAQLQGTNRQWLERIQLEGALASEFASKLTASRSIPDAIAACQDWTSRRFEMMAKDGKHLLDDTQKLMQIGAHFFASGWPTESRGAST